MHSTLIYDGHVVDGSGRAPFRADVLVQDGKIAAIGRDLVATKGASRVDASGAFVTPGFIDIHTHLDPSLFWDPTSDPMPQHGVTTAIIGNCSLSLAPLRPAQRASLSAAFAYIEDIPAEVFRSAVSWNWESFPDYLDVIDSGTSLNIAALVGHSALRLYVLGDEAWTRAARPNEIAEMAQVLDGSMAAGAIGLSTSFFDEDGKGNPVPSRLAAEEELAALVEVLHRRRGLFEFVPNLAGDYDGNLRLVARLCANKNVVATWTGGTGYIPWYPELHRHRLSVLDECRATGADMHPQISPRPVDVRVNWSRSMAFQTMASSWQLVIVGDDESKRALLTDNVWRANARAEWDSVPMSIFPVRAPHKVRLIGATRPENQRWIGRTLADLIGERGGHPSDALADWVLENDLAPEIVCVGIANDDDDAVWEIMRHPDVLVGSSDAGAHSGMLSAYGDTTLLLTRFVRERHDLTLQEAIRQLTSRPAALLGWTDRGVLTPGAIADLNVFALDELQWEAELFVDDMPNGGRRLTRPGGGFRMTMVSGVPTQVMGQVTSARPGRVMRRNHG